MVAAKDQGVDELVEAVERHREFLERDGPARGERAHPGRRCSSSPCCASGCSGAPSTELEPREGRLDEVALAIARRQADPYALAETLARQLATDRVPAPSPPHRARASQALPTGWVWTRWTRWTGLAALTHKSYCQRAPGRGRRTTSGWSSSATRWWTWPSATG